MTRTRKVAFPTWITLPLAREVLAHVAQISNLQVDVMRQEHKIAELGEALANVAETTSKCGQYQEQRIQHLTERMACLDDDIEKLHKMIGRMNGSTSPWRYQYETLRRV